MSSSQNHRIRSHRSYEKRARAMNALQRTNAVKRQTHGFLDMLKQIHAFKRKQPQQPKAARVQIDKGL